MIPNWSSWKFSTIINNVMLCFLRYFSWSHWTKRLKASKFEYIFTPALFYKIFLRIWGFFLNFNVETLRGLYSFIVQLMKDWLFFNTMCWTSVRFQQISLLSNPCLINHMKVRSKILPEVRRRIWQQNTNILHVYSISYMRNLNLNFAAEHFPHPVIFSVDHETF